MKMFIKNQLEKCTVLFYLPDNSQHEIQFTEIDNTGPFSKYLNFLNQWFKWLMDSDALVLNESLIKHATPEKMNTNILQSHLNQLKLFNYTLKLDDYVPNDIVDKSDNDLSLSVSNLLKQNSNFLKNISK